jgi:hypothetical protein
MQFLASNLVPRSIQGHFLNALYNLNTLNPALASDVSLVIFFMVNLDVEVCLFIISSTIDA